LKTFKYRPEKMFKSDEGDTKSPFVGVVEIEVPLYVERLDLVKSLDIDPNNPGLDNAVDLIKETKKRIKSIKLEAKGQTDKIESFDDLSYYKEGADIINDIGRMMVNGFPLGNH